jgi:hypothetical protein
MKRGRILTKCVREAGHRELPVPLDVASPAAAIVSAATLRSDLSIQSLESDRARTRGNA